ncbi:MAG: FAD-dependent oxidoreductase [Actinomycetota bacterium]|nr:FAD-dependent oxidoreductase [Actinomycetota bacterium]
MDSHEVRFIERIGCGADIAAFRFTKPKGYTFAAGQYLTLTLSTAEGDQTKPFTHSQAPADPYLEITTRLSGSAFKNALEALAPGDTVHVAGPAGHLVLPAEERSLVFLVGGVGITPCRSMLRDLIGRGERVEAVVLFGNRDESCVPYRDELEAMAPYGVCVVHVLEDPPEDWHGERGFISSGTVRRHVADDTRWLYLTSGPPVMVEAMERVLDEVQVPLSRRMVERFGQR